MLKNLKKKVKYIIYAVRVLPFGLRKENLQNDTFYKLTVAYIYKVVIPRKENPLTYFNEAPFMQIKHI
ncbi:hypothetical protein BpHYR1_038940 [Brachionus plicatilis]|uniref:Uncharacterized protein n=1 Tax=Brachionus plicatilis TaxID=10195 RepID=A0A3M7PLB7_BRAPC|nr:hypothetical protein BpHYR1_038940 [Brachionus plicatilis]